MNRAPYGGSLTMTYDEPARALEAEVTLSADLWFDDDPADYPLSYSFAYGTAGADQATASALGKLMVKQTAASDDDSNPNTLDGLMKELLRPMIK